MLELQPNLSELPSDLFALRILCLWDGEEAPLLYSPEYPIVRHDVITVRSVFANLSASESCHGNPAIPYRNGWAASSTLSRLLVNPVVFHLRKL